jgi:hypothetical protein
MLVYTRSRSKMLTNETRIAISLSIQIVLPCNGDKTNKAVDCLNI